MSAAPRPVSPAVCQICGQAKKRSDLVPAALVRAPLVERIRSAYPSWSQDGFICHDDLNRFRGDYVQVLMAEEKGELSSLERSVIESLARHETLAEDVETAFQKKLTIGERLRKGDELEDLFDTFVQMTYSLKALQTGRLATLDATIQKAEAEAVSPEVLKGLRALRAQLCLGLTDIEAPPRPSRHSGA